MAWSTEQATAHAALVRALHDPDALAEPMVYEVWEDGEITLTKGGSLYGYRTLHCIMPGIPSYALPWDSLPMVNEHHSRIACRDYETAMRARSYIVGD